MMASGDQKLCLVDIVPDEILIYIFSKIPMRDLLLCVRQVCIRWYYLSRDETLWREIDFSLLCVGSEHKDKEKNSKGVEKLLQEAEDFVERIIFSNVSFSSCVYQLFSSSIEDKDNFSFKKLKSLDYSYADLKIGSLQRALRLLTNLEELIIVHANILYGEVIDEAIHLPCLKKLVFHDSHHWDMLLLDHRLESRRMNGKRKTIQVSQNCRELEWVELDTIWIDFDNDVIKSFTKNCPNLKRLSVTWSNHITSSAFVNSLACSNLTHLGLADRQEREPYLNFVLPNFPNLISLSVSGRDVHTDDCIALSNFCPKLQELVFEMKSMRDHDRLFDFNFHQHNSLSGSNLQHIVEGCKQLRKFHAPCSKVDDDSVMKLSLTCLHLEDVNFMHCPLLSVQSLLSLSQNSPNMKFANFQHTFNPLDYLKLFLTKCPNLQEVNFDISITDVISFSSSPVQSPGNSSCVCSMLPMLRDDFLHSASGFDEELPFIDVLNGEESTCDCFDNEIITDTSTTPLEMPMENISLDETLDIVDYNPVAPIHCHITKISLKNSNIADKTLQEIFHLCPDLTHIVLDGCLDLTNEAVITLVKCCRNLKVLMMSAKQANSTDVGDVSLMEITKYSKNLEVLSILYNRNITHMGVFAIFRSLDLTLRKLRSLSFCVGSYYGCKLPLRPPYGANYLTGQSQFSIEDGISSEFRILHLEFKERRAT